MTNAAEKTDQIVNGINTGRIIELATTMSQQSEFAKFRFQANNDWIGGSRSRTSVKDFYAGNNERTERAKALTIGADQPAFLGGENTAPNAVEHYLNSLVSCLSTTIVAHASVQGIKIEALAINAEGTMDARGFFGVSEAVRRGYSKVKVGIKAKATTDEETLRNLINYSPVYEMVSKALPVEVDIAVE
ncbi:MAG: OsmC family protein [Motiliproteus sp.]